MERTGIIVILLSILLVSGLVLIAWSSLLQRKAHRQGQKSTKKALSLMVVGCLLLLTVVGNLCSATIGSFQKQEMKYQSADYATATAIVISAHATASAQGTLTPHQP